MELVLFLSEKHQRGWAESHVQATLALLFCLPCPPIQVEEDGQRVGAGFRSGLGASFQASCHRQPVAVERPGGAQ